MPYAYHIGLSFSNTFSGAMLIKIVVWNVPSFFQISLWVRHFSSHWINDWKFTKVTKVNRQLIRPSNISFVSWTLLPNLTVVLLSCSGLFFYTKIFAFHSLLCLIDHHKKSICLVGKPESFLRTWFSGSCVDDDRQREFSFRKLLNNGKFLFPHQKLDKSLVSTFEGQKFLTIKRYFTKS